MANQHPWWQEPPLSPNRTPNNIRGSPGTLQRVLLGCTYDENIPVSEKSPYKTTLYPGPVKPGSQTTSSQFHLPALNTTKCAQQTLAIPRTSSSSFTTITVFGVLILVAAIVVMGMNLFSASPVTETATVTETKKGWTYDQAEEWNSQLYHLNSAIFALHQMHESDAMEIKSMQEKLTALEDQLLHFTPLAAVNDITGRINSLEKDMVSSSELSSLVDSRLADVYTMQKETQVELTNKLHQHTNEMFDASRRLAETLEYRTSVQTEQLNSAIQMLSQAVQGHEESLEHLHEVVKQSSSDYANAISQVIQLLNQKTVQQDESVSSLLAKLRSYQEEKDQIYWTKYLELENRFYDLQLAFLQSDLRPAYLKLPPRLVDIAATENGGRIVSKLFLLLNLC